MRAGLSTQNPRFPFLGRLGERGRRELGALAATRVVGGRKLLRRGDAANGAYLVLEGAMRVYYITPEGREATLYRVDPGGTCVLALAATFNDAPYPAWVDAGASGVEFVRVPADVFRRLLDDEAFRAFVYGALTGRLFELMARLEEVRSASMEERVARYLLARAREAADGTVRMTQTGIASELGTAREVVFRSLRKLVQRGVIASGRGCIRVVDPRALEAIARGSE